MKKILMDCPDCAGYAGDKTCEMCEGNGELHVILLDSGEVVINVRDILSRDYAGNLVVHETSRDVEDALAARLKGLGYVKLDPGEVVAPAVFEDFEIGSGK